MSAKRIIISLVLALALLAITGTTPAESTNSIPNQNGVLEEIRERGVLRVGTAGDYQPMSYLDPETGTYIGFDAELAEDLASSLGVKIEYITTSWPTLMEDTLAGKFDLAICGITVTDARKEQALMSDGYLINGKTILCRAEDAEKYTSLKTINKPKVRVMENPGGLNEKFARENLPDAKLIIHEVNQEIPGLIASGEADVMITEVMEAGFYAGKDSRLAAPLIEEPFTQGKLGVLMPKGSEDLLEYVNEFIQKEKESGRIDELAKKYIYQSEKSEEGEAHTLIDAENHWALLTVLFAATALAIWLEQKYKWASKVSGAIITLIIAILLVNTHIIPAESHLYDDVIWGYAVPLAIPLLLLQTNIRKMRKEAGRFLAIFLIGAAGTVTGAILATLLLRNASDGIPGVAAMMTGSYIGGGVNFTALSDAFKATPTIKASATVADNLNMAIYFLVLLSFAGSAWLRKRYPHPHIDDVMKNGKNNQNAETLASQYWARKEISLKDVALDLAYAAIIVFLSRLIGGFFSKMIPTGNWFTQMLNTFFGSQYVWITNLSLIWSTGFEKQASNMRGAQEIGTWMIYLFFFVIGVPASVGILIRNAPILLLFCMIIVLVNMAFCFAGGKLMKFNLEEIILASNANIGGPTTAAGMAISQGWVKLIGPCMLVGTFGYVIGTWLGILVGSLLGA